MAKIDILGVKVNTYTFLGTLREVENLLEKKKSGYIVTPNPEIVTKAYRDDNFKEILNEALLSVADGVGIVWAAKFLSLPLKSKHYFLKKIEASFQALWVLLALLFYRSYVYTVIPERVTGVDLTWEVVKLCAERRWPIFLLGGAPGVAQEAAHRLQLIHPKLKIADVYAGSGEKDEDEYLEHRIRDSKARVIFVAYGAPKQELWLARNLPKFKNALGFGIGGTFDFIAEAASVHDPDIPAKRAPEWLRSLGLEWLYRFIVQPKRFGRVKTALFDFIDLTVNYKVNFG